MPCTATTRDSLTRTTLRTGLLTLAFLALGLWTRAIASPTAVGPPKIRLSNAELGREILIEKFVAALSTADREDIERLRIDENEYRSLILPGSVQPGQPPRIIPADKSRYFWQLGDTKSRYSLNALLRSYGGRPYSIDRVDFQRVERFAWYTAHRDPVIYLKASNGTVHELRLGSIAEFNGRYKFISYYSD